MAFMDSHVPVQALRCARHSGTAFREFLALFVVAVGLITALSFIRSCAYRVVRLRNAKANPGCSVCGERCCQRTGLPHRIILSGR